MKVRRGAAAAALVAGAAAQSTSSPSLPVSYTTLTVDDCPSAGIETLMTVTQGLTITYCPECEWGSSGGPTAAPTTSKPPGHTTVYTTTYLSLCETGTVPVTYTVTESCEEPTPTWTPGPSHIPNGFTVTVKECTVCDKTPVPVTITEPCGCDATSGVPAPPKPTSGGGNPIQQIPDGQVQNPAPGGNSGSGPAPTGGSWTPEEQCDGKSCGGTGNGSTPPPGGSGSNPPSGGSGSNPPSGGSGSTPSNPASPGSSSPAGGNGGNVPPSPSAGSGSTPPYPTTSSAAPQCPGPECRAKATGGAEGPGDSYPTGNTSQITPPPYEGQASTSQLGFITSIVLSFLVGGLAFAL